MNAPRDWLRQCNAHRSIPRQTARPLPNRLLEISPRDQAIRTIQLVSTEGLTGQYAALSYCWGGLQKGILTSSNIDAWYQNINEAYLSNTVRDAIKVTRGTGLQYLWVDALCIVQDSESDKHRDIASMAYIYQNSTLTIVAASASNSKEGFLEFRKYSENSFKIPVLIRSG